MYGYLIQTLKDRENKNSWKHINLTKNRRNTSTMMQAEHGLFTPLGLCLNAVMKREYAT